jgi:hypothetical protein
VLLSALIKNDEGGRQCFIHLYSPFYANNGPSSHEFVKALPDYAEATFVNLMKRVFEETDAPSVPQGEALRPPAL